MEDYEENQWPGWEESVNYGRWFLSENPLQYHHDAWQVGAAEWQNREGKNKGGEMWNNKEQKSSYQHCKRNTLQT